MLKRAGGWPPAPPGARTPRERDNSLGMRRQRLSVRARIGGAPADGLYTRSLARAESSRAPRHGSQGGEAGGHRERSRWSRQTAFLPSRSL